MDNNFAKLVSKLNSLLFTATLLEREPGEKLDNDFLDLQRVYAEIEDAYKANQIGMCQKDALKSLYYEVAEVYHRAMD